ncbi:ATP-binding cassette domain-containing protein, partial [candidate division KSB3 bacterium]|nr:ATP-binding cassette domain-containing protein [candidate division KSB3 bacterium]MBD3323525.1 ATP-binding cassette domain-containing protein [candidate division KSB3 bacterium]
MHNLKTLIPLLKRHRLELAVGFLFMLLQNYGYMKSPAYMQQALDELTDANRVDVITQALLLVAAYTLLTVASMFLMRKLIIGVSRKIEYTLRAQLYQKFLSLDMAFFLKNETGDLVSRCTNDLNEVRLLLGPGIMYIPNSLSRLLLFLPVLISLSLPLMMAIVVMMIVIIALILVVMPRLRPMYRRIQEFMGVINNRVWQVISGITTIKLYTLEDIETERFKTLNEEYIRRQLRVVKIRGFLWPLFIFVFSLTELLILLIGGRQVIQDEMTIGQLLQFNVMVAHLTFPVLSLGWVMSLIQQGMSAMGRINFILNYPVETRTDWKALETDDLVFETNNLSYRYPEHREPVLPQTATTHPQKDAKPPLSKIEGPVITPPVVHLSQERTSELVLNQMNLTITPGQVVGITGTIGSGKTSLLNVLVGLYRPERGMVFVNGIDICDIQPESLFSKISVVPQETFLFSRSIAENVSLANNGQVRLDAVKDAVRSAGLEKDVLTFPHQYDQVLGERGITLSGGQKQRTAIARALLKSSPVLIFDDALSSV